MQVEVFSKVEIDRCTRCYGIWFDVGEVARAALCAVPALREQGPSPRTCPLCLQALTVGRMDQVEVDACETCKGTYLDAGGLERLRARDAADPSMKSATLDETMEPPASQELRLWGLLMGGTSV